jgi:hypothetical protein
MTGLQEGMTDPLVDEVRQRRRELSAQFGNELSRLCEAIRKIEAEHPEKVVDLRRVTADTAPED